MSGGLLELGGELAALWLVIGALDMGLNHCPNEGCLTENTQAVHSAFSGGGVIFQGDRISEELYFRRDTSLGYGPFQVLYGASLTTDGDFWAGIGAGHRMEWDMGRSDAFVQFSFMPGVYLQGGGPDLGGEVSFRSAVELGIEDRNGIRYAFSVDHRSNGGLHEGNPGIETVQFRVSIPLR